MLVKMGKVPGNSGSGVMESQEVPAPHGIFEKGAACRPQLGILSSLISLVFINRMSARYSPPICISV